MGIKGANDHFSDPQCETPSMVFKVHTSLAGVSWMEVKSGL